MKIVAVSAITSYTLCRVEIDRQELPIGKRYQKGIERTLGVSNK